MIISGTATEAWFLFNAPWMVKSADWIPGRRWEFKRRICRTTRLHWISLSLWKSVVASLMCPHLEVQKWTKCCWKWRREGSHKWNSMSDHYREELRWCGGGGGGWEDDGESLTLASPDLSIFDYGQLHTDLMLITFQFSWGTFSFAQSHIRSIQLVTTANGTFIIVQVQCNPLFGLAHKFKGHRRGYNTRCNYLSCVPWENPQDTTSRALRKANAAHFIVLQVYCAQRSPPLNIFHPRTLYLLSGRKLLTAVCHRDGL